MRPFALPLVLAAATLVGCRSVRPTPADAPFSPAIAYDRLGVPTFAEGVTCQQHAPPVLDLSAPAVRAALRDAHAYFAPGSRFARAEVEVRHTLLVDTTGHVAYAFSRSGAQAAGDPIGQRYRGWRVGAATCDGRPVTSSVDLNLRVTRGG